MSHTTTRNSVSTSIYQLLLLAYPDDFRQEYGAQMLQLFRDSYRAQRVHQQVFGVLSLWYRTLLDLIETAPKEHLDRLRKSRSNMKNLKRDILAVLGTLAILVAAFLLLSYGRRHEVSSILVFGRALDALVTAGIVGNLIVFLLVKVTRLSPLRTAMGTFLIVNAALLVVAAMIGTRVDPGFSFPGILVAHIFSFLFWSAVHWLWSLGKDSRQMAVSSGQ
jgi:hypothetical protein